MRPLPTPEEMAAADAAAISAGTPAEVLMDRAGRALAREVLSVAGRRYGLRVVLVCGKGNNGGDGFVAARALMRDGARADCLVVGDLVDFDGPAAHHLSLLRAANGRVDKFQAGELEGADVVVDALFGTGFRGVVEGEAAQAIEAINAYASPVVSADIPSGVNGTTGSAEGLAVEAAATVAMGAEKIGTAVGRGAALAGNVAITDIGIPVTTNDAFMVERDDVTALLPSRAPDAHKRSGGAVALLAGSDAMTGAAVLSALGAMRMGAGYVTVGSSRGTVAALQGLLPEILARVVADEDHLGAGALDRFRDVVDKADALVLGPGLGQGDAQRDLVDRVLLELDAALVLDADALNALEDHTGSLEKRSGATILTPHPAELARLLGTDTDAVQANRVAAARQAASTFGCVVLLKGFRTIVARPDGMIAVNPTGGPELATAGTGDVLAGAVAVLLAAGLEPFEAAWVAAYVHGLAGSLAAAPVGSSGVVAGDVAEALADAAGSLQEQSPT